MFAFEVVVEPTCYSKNEYVGTIEFAHKAFELRQVFRIIKRATVMIRCCSFPDRRGYLPDFAALEKYFCVFVYISCTKTQNFCAHAPTNLW